MKSKEEDGARQVALTAGYFTVIAGLIAGGSTAVNTLLEQQNFLIAGILFIAMLIAIIYVTGRISRLHTDKSIKKLSKNLPSWELLYEHNESGQAVFGEVDDLIDAVGKGISNKS